MQVALAVFSKSRLLQSISVLAVASVASISGAQAQTANTSPSSANVLNLLSPFLGLNSGSVGPTTLADSLSEAISVNNSASPALQELSFSDKNLLSGPLEHVTGDRTQTTSLLGVAANLGGAIPDQPAPPTGGGVSGSQPMGGGLGMQLGTIYADGVNAFANGDHSVLPNTVNLLTSAYGNLTSPNLGAAKNYFANGTTDGKTTAVAPAGFTLPTFNGLPNMTDSVYRLAYLPSTQTPMGEFGNPRPVQVAPPSRLPVLTSTCSIRPRFCGLETNPSFPSGHTTYAYTDSILLGMMAPELYQSMLSRASQFANSRIVLGVHYPLDIIGSRSLVSYDLAQAFTNPDYINNKTTTGHGD